MSPTARPKGDSESAYHFARKLMLLGDSGTGKTCLLIRFKDGTFLDSNFISTVGIDYRNKVVDVDGVRVRLQVWDTAGQERFRSVTHAYYRDADAAMLVFDLTHRASFDHVRNWANEVRERAPAGVAMLLVGNKADAAGGAKRQVPHKEAAALAHANGMPYVETSAKTGNGVHDAFIKLTRQLVQARYGGAGGCKGNRVVLDSSEAQVSRFSAGYCCPTT